MLSFGYCDQIYTNYERPKWLPIKCFKSDGNLINITIWLMLSFG
jgi:hypothetical protein